MPERAAYKKIFRFLFSPENSGKPVMCHLVRHYDVTFNIIGGDTLLGREGFLTVEISGRTDNCRQALDYLREQGIGVVPARRHVTRDANLCMHCGMCTAVCTAEALCVSGAERLVAFEEEQCTACGMCTRICPVGAMRSHTR